MLKIISVPGDAKPKRANILKIFLWEKRTVINNGISIILFKENINFNNIKTSGKANS